MLLLFTRDCSPPSRSLLVPTPLHLEIAFAEHPTTTYPGRWFNTTTAPTIVQHWLVTDWWLCISAWQRLLAHSSGTDVFWTTCSRDTACLVPAAPVSAKHWRFLLRTHGLFGRISPQPTTTYLPPLLLPAGLVVSWLRFAVLHTTYTTTTTIYVPQTSANR